MNIVCPHCGEEIEIEVVVPDAPRRRWRRWALAAALALAALGGCWLYWR